MPWTIGQALYLALVIAAWLSLIIALAYAVYAPPRKARHQESRGATPAPSDARHTAHS